MKIDYKTAIILDLLLLELEMEMEDKGYDLVLDGLTESKEK